MKLLKPINAFLTLFSAESENIYTGGYDPYSRTIVVRRILSPDKTLTITVAEEDTDLPIPTRAEWEALRQAGYVLPEYNPELFRRSQLSGDQVNITLTFFDTEGDLVEEMVDDSGITVTEDGGVTVMDEEEEEEEENLLQPDRASHIAPTGVPDVSIGACSFIIDRRLKSGVYIFIDRGQATDQRIFALDNYTLQQIETLLHVLRDADQLSSEELYSVDEEIMHFGLEVVRSLAFHVRRAIDIERAPSKWKVMRLTFTMRTPALSMLREALKKSFAGATVHLDGSYLTTENSENLQITARVITPSREMMNLKENLSTFNFKSVDVNVRKLKSGKYEFTMEFILKPGSPFTNSLKALLFEKGKALGFESFEMMFSLPDDSSAAEFVVRGERYFSESRINES